MVQYLIKRLLVLLPVMIITSSVVFLVVHMTPGDPAAAILGEEATPEAVQRLREALGLNEPLPIQYARWLSKVVRGELGYSIFYNVPVGQAIRERLEPTVLMGGMALMFSVLYGVPLGVLAAIRHNSFWDYFCTVSASIGVSIPSFWLGLNLILLFGVVLRLLPVAGYVGLSEASGLWPTIRTLLMPAFVLGFISAAVIARMTRANMLEVLRQDYIRTAKAKGLSERVVTYKHALRNSFIPTITVISFQIATLIGGAVVTEQVFGIPGIGMLLVFGVRRRDYPVVQAVVLLMAMVFVFVNLLTDISYAFLDPRVRYG